jgi:glycosyltransferase involved in cell wall biosynthesis
MMLDIAVVILTYNEERHIERCIQSIKKYSDNIYIIDSYSTDNTIQICKSLNVNILQNKFINQSKQFTWALDNINFKTEWTLRLDADEYLEDNLIIEIKNKLPNINKDIVGINLKRKHIFMDKWIKFGGRYPLILLRLWRTGHGYIEDRWMDEHIMVEGGKTITLKNSFCDHNLNNLSFFINKHDWYAGREVVDILLDNLKIKNDKKKLSTKNTSFNVSLKRFFKESFYNKLPIGLGPLLYFLYRYIFLLGFLDGKVGLIYHFLQGFWYRFLVESKLVEYKKAIKGLDNNDEIIKKLSELPSLKS